MSRSIQPHFSFRSEGKNASGSFSDALLPWFARVQRALPWRAPGQAGTRRDPYATLVSECMLQQTQAASVVPYFLRWMARFPTVAALAEAGEEEVLRAWEGLGYYARARNLRAAARWITRELGGVFPRAEAELRALPGVGPYTAAAVATFAFDLPTPPLDANVARVIARLIDFREPAETPTGRAALREAALGWQPAQGAGTFNEALMELGALVCTAQAPQCAQCPARAHCRAEEPAALPVKKERPKTVELRERCAWILQEAQLLLEQSAGAKWRGLWRLPELEPGLATGGGLVTVHYPFTHHRVEMTVFAARAPRELRENQRWVPLTELEKTPLPAPHRRAVRRLINPL